MKINRSIYYHRYGEFVYVRDVEHQKDFLYNEIVGDILDFLCSDASGAQFANLITYLKSRYDLTDTNEEEFQKDISLFMEDLQENEILVDMQQHEQPIQGMAISDQIARYCEENHVLDSLCLEITYRCNERCVHCYLDDVHDTQREQELCLEDYRKLLDEAYALGCFRVLITGGEVSVRPDFLDIAEYAAGKGMLVDLYTNGLSVSDQQFLRICAMKPNSVSVSLYGGDAGIHDSITKVAGSFEKTLRFAMMLKCAGIDVFIKSVAMKQNAESLEKLYQLGKMLHIPISVSLAVGSKGNGEDPGKYRLNCTNCYEKLISLNDRYGDGVANYGELDFVKSLDSPPCSIGKSGLSVDPFGNVNPCNAHKVVLGNIHRDSLEDIWLHSSELQRIRKLKMQDISPKCSQCENIAYCPVCIGFAEQERGESYFCEDVCLIAEAKRRFLESRL